jgi:hypothetical protein
MARLSLFFSLMHRAVLSVGESTRWTAAKHRIAAACGLMIQKYIAGHAYAAQNFPYTDGNYTANPTTDLGSVFKQSNQGGSIMENLLDLFGINYAGPDKAVIFGQVVINYVLGMVGFVALLWLIYAFAKIFTGKEDDEIKNAKKTVVGITVGLVILGASAYIVNFVFYIFAKGY